MRGEQAPHAAQCCPPSALRQLSVDDVRALDAYCRRALDNPYASPLGPEECAAVARYEALLDRWGQPWRSAERGTEVRQ